MHIAGALNNGASQQEVEKVLLQMAPCGILCHHRSLCGDQQGLGTDLLWSRERWKDIKPTRDQGYVAKVQLRKQGSTAARQEGCAYAGFLRVCFASAILPLFPAAPEACVLVPVSV